MNNNDKKNKSLFFSAIRDYLICGSLFPIFIFFLSISTSVVAADEKQQANGTTTLSWTPLIERLVNDGYDKQKMEALFARPEVSFRPGAMASKLQTLIKNNFEKPAQYRSPQRRTSLSRGYLRPRVIAGALSYVGKHREALNCISATYCVSKEVIVAIMLVETRLGEFMGSNAAFNTLASMAVTMNLEMILPFLPDNLVTEDKKEFARLRCSEKAQWAYNELKALIAYAEKRGGDPLSIPGSIYGAIGLCQFMPSNAISYGIDADGDGIADLFTCPDALYSIANYLKQNGWTCNMTRQQQYEVILTYNKSQTYANTILAIAAKLKEE